MAKNKKNFRTKVYLACSQDELRPSMNYAVFQEGKVIATNGHIMVVQSLDDHKFTPDEVAELEGKAIHRKVLQEIMRYDQITVSGDVITATKDMIVAEFKLVSKKETELMKYPDWKRVIPKEPEEREASSIVGLAFGLLDDISKIAFLDSFGRARFFVGAQNECVVICSETYDFERETIIIMPYMTKK